MQNAEIKNKILNGFCIALRLRKHGLHYYFCIFNTQLRFNHQIIVLLRLFSSGLLCAGPERVF